MKRSIVALAFFISFSMHADNKKSKKRTVTFINADEESGVRITIYNMKSGKEITSKKLSAQESLVADVPFIGNTYSFNVQKGIEYAVKAQETGDDALETGLYSLHLRTENDKGTVRIVRRGALITGTEELILVGNDETDQDEGARVREVIMLPDWAKKPTEEPQRGKPEKEEGFQE